MFFDSTMLARIAADVERQGVGARVERVFQPARDEVVIELRRRMPRPQLVISCSAELGRVHWCSDAEPRADVKFPFGDALRRHLRGATLAGVRQTGFDRVLHLEFANCEGLGSRAKAVLVAEITGRHANLVLLNEAGMILACARHVTTAVNRYRETLPGILYIPPPVFDRVSPEAMTPRELMARALSCPELPLRDFLSRTLMGASDVFLAELVARADIPGQICVTAAPAGWAERITDVAREMVGEARMEGPGYIY